VPEVNLAAIVSGPAGYITLSNIRTSATNAAFTVTFDTDQPVLMAMDYWSQNDPSIPPGTAGSVLEGVLRTRHTITTNALPAGNHAGYTFGYSLRLDANDVSGKTLRSQQGFVQLLGARTTGNGKAVPARFNMYGDGTRPANGGGNPARNMEGSGNWSSYTWAQYNPKGTTYPPP
jgi:hypothetical protein